VDTDLGPNTALAARAPRFSPHAAGLGPKNRAALRVCAPDLARQLDELRGHDRLGFGSQGEETPRLQRLYRRAWLSIGEDEIDLQGDVDLHHGDPRARAQLVVGMGDGHRVALILGQIAEDEGLVVWEDDLTLLHHVLDQIDFAEALESGRLRILGTAELEAEKDLCFRRALRAPRLRALTASEWPRAQALLDLHRASGPAPMPAADCLVRRGELLQRETQEALMAFGRRVREVEFETLTSEQEEGLLRGAPRGGLWTINFDPDLIARASAAGCPCVVWEIDPSADALETLGPQDPARDLVSIFSWRRERVTRFRDAGYRRVRHLPIGVDPSFRQPRRRTGAGEDLIFVGSGMRERVRDFDGAFLAAAARDEAREGAWRALWDERHGIERQILENPCRRDVESGLEAARRRLDLPAHIETDYGPAEVRALLGERLAATKRLALLGALDGLPLGVFGEESWEGLLPEGVWRGPVGHGEPLNEVYSNAGVNLDMNRIYQADIATLRVFEASACGGFVLAEYAEDLEPLFDFESEIAVYRDLDELRTQAQHFLAHQPEARRRAHRARDRVLMEHTTRLRVAQILITLAEG
jgi:Glycosyl transferases group 1/DUF based on E. rectale Gene description (DUF3880)